MSDPVTIAFSVSAIAVNVAAMLITVAAMRRQSRNVSARRAAGRD